MKVEIKIYFRFSLPSASSVFSDFSALKTVFRLLNFQLNSALTPYPQAQPAIN